MIQNIKGLVVWLSLLWLSQLFLLPWVSWRFNYQKLTGIRKKPTTYLKISNRL